MCSAITFFLIVFCLWLFAIPTDGIKDIVEKAVSRDSLKVEIDGLKKGLFYNLSADRIVLKDKDKELFYIEAVSGRINPLYLFLIRHKSSFAGKVHEGAIKGNADVSRKKTFFNIMVDNVNIINIPYLKDLGIKGKGLIDAEIIFEDNNGTIKFALNDAQMETSSISGMPLPLELFNIATGLLEIKGDVVRIRSFSFEGENIYGRIKGTIKDAMADLTLELMPEAQAEAKFPALFLIERYKVSPGYYLIPIKTKFPV